MTEQIAVAQYEDQWNPPEGVAPYLRFGGRISDRVLMQFAWKGQRYDPWGNLSLRADQPAFGSFG